MTDSTTTGAGMPLTRAVVYGLVPVAFAFVISCAHGTFTPAGIHLSIRVRSFKRMGCYCPH